MKPHSEPSGLAPAAMLRALKRRKLLLILPVLILTPVVAAYVYHLPLKYRARTLVGTDPAIAGRSTLVKPDAMIALSAQDQLRVIRETILSTATLENLIREYKLYDMPNGHASLQTLDLMKARVEVQVEGPEAFYVGFEDTSAAQAKTIADRLAKIFLDRKSSLQGRRVEQESTFLDAEVADLQAQLKGDDAALRSTRAKAAGDMPERLTANLKTLESLQQQVRAKTDQITEAEARKSALSEEVAALGNQGILEPDAPAKTTADANLEQLKIKLADLKARYTPEHPEIARTAKQIQDMEATAARTPAPVVHSTPNAVQVRYMGLQAELKSIGPRLQTYRRERDVLTEEMKSYEQRVNSSGGYGAALAGRMRDSAATRTRYEAVLSRQQEAKLNHRAEKTGDEFSYKVLEPAQLPVIPSGPHRIRIILAGFFGGLVIGLLSVFIAERANPSFETAEALEAFTNMTVLTSVPAISQTPVQRGKGSKASALVAPQPWSGVGETLTSAQLQLFRNQRLASLTDPQSVAGQQYSILALKLQQWMSQTNGKTILVTSSSGEEGKSLTALNLSLALASASEGRVLLVDADLRLPQVHERLGLSRDHGFSNLLGQDGGDAETYITKVGPLHVMTGGSNRANPVGLLASTRARDILAELKNKYDLIVIDSPPVVPIADSHILAGLADGVVFVVRARRTSPELLLRAVESLGAENVIGLVLNDVELGATPYAYAYRYYQRNYLGRS